MTLAERNFLTRKARYEQPAQATQGKKGGGILGALLGGMVGGAGGAANPMADQGPLPDGGNLGQPGLTPTYTGGEGTHFITLGNPNREQIKLGRLFRPRVNQEAAAALAADPLAPVQPEQETKGFGGFVRRMFGDNANERNAALAQQQGQLRLQKWLLDQQTQGRMGLLDKEHQLSMERLKAQIEAENARQANADQSALQRVRLDDQNRLGLEGMRAVNDLIAKSQDQSFFARQNALNRSTTERGQDLTAENNLLRYTINQKGAPFGFKSITERLIQDDKGNLLNHDPETGMLTPARIGGGTPDGAPDPTKLGNLAPLLKAEDEQNKVNEMLAPPSALGGLKDLGSEAVGMAADVAGKSPFLQYAPPTLVGKAAMNAGGRVLDFLRKRNAATKNQKIANYYE